MSKDEILERIAVKEEMYGELRSELADYVTRNDRLCREVIEDIVELKRLLEEQATDN